MNEVVKDFLDKIDELEDQLQEELHQRREELQFKIRNGKVEFERELRQRNREFRIGLTEYVRKARWLVMLTAPVIYMLIIPFVLMDLFVTIYQAICFPVYGVPKVKRGDYLIFDRVKLDYLNGLEKVNCAYCSYCNGIIAYVVEVASRTEQYWCPIKHAQRPPETHRRYPLFTDYGDGEQYRDKLDRLKKDIR